MKVGFFERPDPRLILSADPTPPAAVAAALKRHALAFAVCFLALAGAYAASIDAGLHATAVTRGSIVATGLDAPVSIVRDGRDIPHIRAANEHDLYFAQGYAQGSDRLFQLDLTRRFAYGRLAEVFGAKALALDKAQRAVDISAVAARQLRALTPRDRAAIAAFSEGVNAAAASQSLPVEFHMLLYRPAPWTPKDSLAVSIVVSLELADSWHDVFARDAVWRERGPRCFDRLFPLSDPRYDVTIGGARNAQPAPGHPVECDASGVAVRPQRDSIGSNAWAAGSTRSVDGHALIANDPHLILTIPGIWYVVDLESPQMHVAGATIPGIPGVVLGHNERLAWALTNAEMATTSVFEAGRLSRRCWVTERFRVRFARDTTASYCRTSRDFSVPNDNVSSATALVRWPIYAERRSAIATVLALDRARDISAALRIIANYRGSPQNFILADRSGKVAYHVAGLVPNDPAWGRYVHPARDRRADFAPIPFARLPQEDPARDAILVSANNKAYASGYPYRLSAQFEPPYRAYRIAELLRLRPRYDAEYFARMQLDTLSPIDLEIARDVVRFARAHPEQEPRAAVLATLGRWDGRFEPDSHAAALEHMLRGSVLGEAPEFSARLDELRGVDHAAARNLESDLDGWFSFAFSQRRAWREAGGMRIEHPLAPMNFAFLNGAWLPGEGDEYTIHLQEPGFAQSLRAVWEVGDWDRGGIAIPSGESGEPGSPHYTDLTRAWVAGSLQPLPFSPAAIAKNAAGTLMLLPRSPGTGSN
ncbi:MAG TPA: penicillin acylase family protein [Candidatus Cybelea sp.]|nr:penicillin acylase family protein [Candidatus Cybelea sp.]